MKLRAQQKQWDRLGSEDPFWAILADPQKRNRRWNPEDFFATGRAEVADAMQFMEALGYPAVRRRALDFGCGAGRVTQALASWFDCVVGVDVSPNMIELAGSYNRVGARCSYTVNGDDDLRQFENASFDLVYSKIVLQHVPPQIARRYVREFVRLLAPGGLALFQLPSRLRARSRAYAAMYGLSLAVLRSVGRPRLVEMHGVARSVVERDIAQCGGEVLAVSADGSAGPAWESYLYAVTKGRREMRG